MQKNSVVETARMLLNEGYRVHPVYGIHKDGRCGCGSLHEDKQGQPIGKHPINEDWSRRPPLLHYFPNAEPLNIALECGPQPNGVELLGIDFDNMPASIYSTCHSVTRRGTHQYFDLRHTGLSLSAKCYLDLSGSREAGFPNGIDFKYKGGALLIEPSLHREGAYLTTLDELRFRRVPKPDARIEAYIRGLIAGYIMRRDSRRGK